MRTNRQYLVKRLIERGDLPTLPEVMTRIVQCVENPLTSASDLTDIISTDPAITARALRLANSAFYGSRYQVDTLRRAVIILGFESLKLLALATSVMDVLASSASRSWNPREFWLHSLGTGKAAQLLAERYCPRVPAATCFTAGLLHDVGKLAFAVTLGEEYEAVLREAREKGWATHVAELELLGTTHTEVGGWILEEWCFPPELTGTVRYQNHAERYAGRYPEIPALVHAGCRLARMSGYGLAGDHDGLDGRGVMLGSTPLGFEEVRELVGALEENLPQAGMLLKAISDVHE